MAQSPASVRGLLTWAATYWKWLLSAAAGFYVLIVQGREIFPVCARLYRRVRGVPESPYSAHAGGFGTDVNPRFGFKFAYPSKWDRSDPDNCDGSLYVHPTYGSVEVRAWGAWPVVWPTLEEWVANTLDPHSEAGIQAVRKVDSGKYHTRQVGKHVGRRKVPGVRAVYDLKAGKKKYRVMQLFVQGDGPQVGVRCVAPKHLYRGFEPLFLHVCDSLELIETCFSVEGTGR
jgi:hypothetical protein